MIGRVVVELGPGAECELLEVGQALLVLQVLVVQLLVHGHLVDAARVGAVRRRRRRVDQRQLVARGVRRRPTVHDLQGTTVKHTRFFIS